MRLNIACLVLLALALALPAFAQDAEVSPEKEAFQIQPAKVPTGAQDFQIRLVSNQADLFATSSRRPVKLSFSAGVELVEGSAKLKNDGEMEARINVGESTFGTITVSVTLYSPDGTKAIRQERATMGVIGPISTGPDEVKVSVDSVRLVRVNSEDEQVAGSITLTGKVNGSITLTPPAGTLFVQGSEPQIVVTPAEVRAIEVTQAPSLDTLTFKVLNEAGREATVTIGNLRLNTRTFTVLGGSEGPLSMTVGGPSIGDEALLVTNAHTALEKLEGEDVPEDPDDISGTPDTNSDNSSSDTNRPLNTRVNNSSNRSSSPSSRESSSRDSGLGSNGNTRRTNPPASNNARSAAPNVNRNWGRNTGYRSNRAPGRSNNSVSNRGSAGGPSGAARDTGDGAGSVSLGGNEEAPDSDAEGRDEVKSDEPAGGEVKSKRKKEDPAWWQKIPVRAARSSPRVFFADKSYKPLSSVVLDELRSGEGIATKVWIVLERGEDLTDKVDTVTVTLKIGMERREITLTETGENTAVFRSDSEGILVASPDSD